MLLTTMSFGTTSSEVDVNWLVCMYASVCVCVCVFACVCICVCLRVLSYESVCECLRVYTYICSTDVLYV